MTRIILVALTFGLLNLAAAADVVIVNETFDGYADTAAFQAVWVPRAGNGNAAVQPADVDSGVLTSDNTTFPGIQGNAVDHIGATASSPGMVNQYEPAMGGPFPGDEVLPTAAQSLFLSADIFDGASGNERMTVGLRNRTQTGNLLELGFYNSNSCDPTVCTVTPQNAVSTDPGFYTGTGYGYRLQLFQTPVQPPLLVQPDWQYFQLPPELDRATDADTIVNIADIGAGWHRFSATITPDTVTIEIDLFRDGLRNTSITPDEISGIRPGTPGVDASQTWNLATAAQGFDSLRIGGPSGLASAGTGVTGFDNILLKLVDVSTGNTPDFNGDGTVNAADYTRWRDNLGLMGTGTQATGDANGDLNVDQTDYDLWKAAYGTMPGSGAVVASGVPEPATGLLALAGLFSVLMLRANARKAA